MAFSVRRWVSSTRRRRRPGRRRRRRRGVEDGPAEGRAERGVQRARQGGVRADRGGREFEHEKLEEPAAKIRELREKRGTTANPRPPPSGRTSEPPEPPSTAPAARRRPTGRGGLAPRREAPEHDAEQRVAEVACANARGLESRFGGTPCSPLAGWRRSTTGVQRVERDVLGEREGECEPARLVARFAAGARGRRGRRRRRCAAWIARAASGQSRERVTAFPSRATSE